jgi:hypothetical protein
VTGPPGLPTAPRRIVFVDVENGSRVQHVAALLRLLRIPDASGTRVVAVGNWRVVGLETARLLARSGATLVHSAPRPGVKDWSDLRIAVEAGRWLGRAHPNDVLDIVSDDHAFDAIGDVAAAHGVTFRRFSARNADPRPGFPSPRPRSRPRTTP